MIKEITRRLDRNVPFTTKEELWQLFEKEQQATVRHSRRTEETVGKVTQALGWSTDSIALAKEAARWHDVGKRYPEHLPPFNTETKFTPEQKQAMLEHCRLGSQDLAALEFPYAVVMTALLHHSIGSAEFLQLPQDTQEIITVVAMVDIDDAILGEVRPYQIEVLTKEHVEMEWTDKLGTFLTPSLRAAFEQVKEEA